MDEILDAIIDLLESGETVPDSVLDEIINFLEREVGENQSSVEPPIPTGADLLWILSGSNPKTFTEYLSTFPDKSLNALARDPSRLQNVINRLDKQITVPAGEVADGIPKSDIQSSNIYGFSYNPRNQKLYVKFNGKDSMTDGPVYEYEGVPAQIFKMFKNGAVPAKTSGSNKWGQWWQGKQPSLGASLFGLIKQGAYPYQKVA